MVRRYYDLPSLTSLAVFEAAARHLSFKLAAAELNVTPGAVSRQIKAIEEEFDALLFARLPNGVELTSKGEELYATLARGFSQFADTVKTIKRGNRESSVTVACSDAFASLWLMPRMADFWERHPDIRIDHMISDSSRDYRRAEVELRIRYGFGAWPNETVEYLFDEKLYPVCGSEFFDRHPQAKAADLAELPLLYVDWADPDWPGWNEVLSRASVAADSSGGKRFGKCTAAWLAAQANQGVALGWHRLVDPLIRDGKLKRFTDLELAASGSYYLTFNDNRDLSTGAEIFRSWLHETARDLMAPKALTWQ